MLNFILLQAEMAAEGEAAEHAGGCRGRGRDDRGSAV